MSDKPSDSVAGVNDEDLKQVLREIASIPSSQEGDAERFGREVRAVVERRAQSGWANEVSHDVAVFVLVDYPRDVRKRLGGTRVLDLIATQELLMGRVFFLNRDASNGTAIPFPIAKPAEILDWLADNGFGECVMIFAYRAEKLMISRKRGVGDEAKRDPIRDIPPTATLPELLEALSFFHRMKLLTPILCPDGVWERSRASQYVPGARPEKCIQKELKGALNFWFRGVVRAELEDSTDIGRIDVRLLRAEPGPLSYWAIIELKVARSKRHAAVGKRSSSVSFSENAHAIADGVIQAYSYRANRKADEGLLEVYDLRSDKSSDIFRHRVVQDALAKCKPPPILNVRPVYGSAADARAAGQV